MGALPSLRLVQRAHSESPIHTLEEGEEVGTGDRATLWTATSTRREAALKRLVAN